MSEALASADLIAEIRALRAEVDRLNRSPSGRFAVQIASAKSGVPSDLDYAALGSRDSTPPVGWLVTNSAAKVLYVKTTATTRSTDGTITVLGVWSSVAMS